MFRWTLHNIDTGVVQKLSKDPRGYEELKLNHNRSEKWHGVQYTFSSELGFFCKGAGKELVDAAYDAKGQEAIVKIKMEVKCNGAWTTILKGKLNFSTYRQEFKRNVLYTFLNAENEDITHLIQNREELEVDLLRTTSLDGVTALNSYPFVGYDLNLHSKIVHIESIFDIKDSGCCFRLVAAGLYVLYMMPRITVIKGDFEKTQPSEPTCSFSNLYESGVSIVNTVNSAVFVQPQVVTISWHVRAIVTITTYEVTLTPDPCTDDCGTKALQPTLYDSVDLRLRIFVGNPDGTLSEADDCTIPINQAGIKYFDIVVEPGFAVSGNPTSRGLGDNIGSRQIIMNPGDRVWAYWGVDFNMTAPCDIKFAFEYVNGEINIQSDTVYSETLCKSIAIHEAWSRLSEIITDQNLAFYSEFFGRTDSNIVYAQDGCGSRVAITSGKNIRRLPNNPPIIQSLEKMYDSCDAIWGIGLGIERYQNRDVIRVEELDYFYSDVVVLKMDNVPNIQMSHLSELVYNEINIGFKKWETNNVNGLDEPLTKINYLVPPVKSNKQKFEKISGFVAAMYAIELTRRSGDVETKDTSYDEDTFVIALRNDDLTYAEKNENMQSVAGLISPETAYNLRFLLSSTFDRLKNQFVAGLTKLGSLINPVIMPAQGEGNQSVNYAYEPNGCAGDHYGTPQINGRNGKYPDAQARRDNPIWLPEEYTFDFPLPFSDYLKLVANPYGLIQFSSTDKNHLSGWITAHEYDIRHKKGSFTILRSAGVPSPDLVMNNSLGDFYFPDFNSSDFYT